MADYQRGQTENGGGDRGSHMGSTGVPDTQRVSNISLVSRPDNINATATNSVSTFGQDQKFNEDVASNGSRGSIVKTTKDELFVNGSAGPSPALAKRNPIDSGHEMMDNLLDDVGNQPVHDLDIKTN